MNENSELRFAEAFAGVEHQGFTVMENRQQVHNAYVKDKEAFQRVRRILRHWIGTYKSLHRRRRHGREGERQQALNNLSLCLISWWHVDPYKIFGKPYDYK